MYARRLSQADKRRRPSIDLLAQEIARNGGQAVPVVTDATSESDIRRLFGTAGDDLDLAIYNAGNNTRVMTCSGWHSRHGSCEPFCSTLLFGIAEIRREHLLLRYQQKCQQNGRLERIFTSDFNAPQKFFRKSGIKPMF
jgi:hypothetical protein